jgi:hypothetical protein
LAAGVQLSCWIAALRQWLVVVEDLRFDREEAHPQVMTLLIWSAPAPNYAPHCA